MNLFPLAILLILVGLIVGFVAGLIWKENRPLGAKGDYIIGVVAALAIGFIDYYVIPAMGFSDTMRWAGVATEPWLGGLLILWLVRYAKNRQ